MESPNNEGRQHGDGPADSPEATRRLYFVGESIRAGLQGHGGDVRDGHEPGRIGEDTSGPIAATSEPSWLAHTMHTERRPLNVDRSDGRDGQDGGRPEAHSEFGTRSEVRGLADAERGRCEQRDPRQWPVSILNENGSTSGPGPVNGFWRDADWIGCRDGKFRPVRPGSFPLASRDSPDVVLIGSDGKQYASFKAGEARVGRLRLYGDAICVPVATEFILAYMEANGANDVIEVVA